MEVLCCATMGGAKVMGRSEELGSVKAGKLADLLVVEGDVLANIRLLEDRTRFVAVVQGGIVRAGTTACRG